MCGGGSYGHWAQMLQVSNVDLAFVQETRAPSTFPPDLVETHDLTVGCWHAAPHGKWGSALWLRRPGIGTLDLGGPSWWAAGGVVNVSGEEFFACSVHLGVARPGSYVASANAFLDRLAELRLRLPMIVSGDWNLTPGRRQPHEALNNSKAELALIDRMRDEFGLVSAWSHHKPDDELPQTLRWVKEPKAPYHCDAIMLSSYWHDRVADATVHVGSPWKGLSDHNPVSVELSPRHA